MAESIVDELSRVAGRCEAVGQPFDAEPLSSTYERLIKAAQCLHNAWSESYIGYHAFIYTAGFRPRETGEHFNSEWGFRSTYTGYYNNPEVWREYEYEPVRDEILRRAAVSADAVARIEDAATVASNAFEESKEELLPLFEAILAARDDPPLKEAYTRLKELESHTSRASIVMPRLPGTRMSRDQIAMTQGTGVPHHLFFEAWLTELRSYGTQAKELSKIARRATRYLRQTYKLQGKPMAKTSGKVFIGHGHSTAWRDLKDFLGERLRLPYDEFNRVPTAGMSNKERLEAMLDEASFAFLVLTAEDEHADATLHARENVVHEAGLFQGRLGFKRAIILREEDCAEFSNVEGLVQIWFPKGSIKTIFEDIRRVLEREGILSNPNTDH